MKKEVAEKLVETLESGKFKQTRGRLCKKLEGDICMCVLGVLCELSGLGEWEEQEEEIYFKDGNRNSWRQYVPPSVLDWAGLEREEAEQLMRLNDTKAYTFHQLSQEIRQRYLS